MDIETRELGMLEGTRTEVGLSRTGESEPSGHGRVESYEAKATKLYILDL
jgi:hypothetical protein